jgi:Cdc6-like AAA superfamily ATPase
MINSRPLTALLIGGRSGVGKTTVSYEVSELLRRHDIAHALVDGDNLDAVYPNVDGPALAEANLAALWRNYRALGHCRLIYVNTVSVLEADMIRRALGDGEVGITGILLTADDATARERLGLREIGSTLDVHLERSARAARHLEATASGAVHRVATDDRPVGEIAAEIVRLTGWAEGAGQ